MSVCTRCDYCGELREFPSLKLKVSIRVKGGTIVYRDICSDECLVEWAKDRIAERAARKAREAAQGAEVTPTPLVMATQAVSA